MALLIRGLSRGGEALGAPLVGRFDAGEGTIGRSFGATLALPDPERLISRVQAKIVRRDDGYWLEDVGRSRSIVHNGEILEVGARVRLAPGDELFVGAYQLEIADEPEPEAPPLEPPPPREPSIDELLDLDGAVASPAERLDDRTPGFDPDGGGPPADVAAAPRVAPDPSTAELWQAFLDGAGVDVLQRDAATPETMRLAGRMLRAATGGLLQLVAMRAAAKEELHAERTLIQAQQNNPLKFAPDVDSALRQLLQPPARGFLPAVAAIHDAVDDLQSHQVGTMAGMRSALDGVLRRFEPALLEARLTDKSLLEALLPMNRKARLWDLFLENYARIRGEAADDFQVLFGDAFAEAYAEQVERLKQRRRAVGRGEA